MIKIIPFFSPLSSKSEQEDTLSQLSLDQTQIIFPELFSPKDHIPQSNEKIYFFVGTGGTENAMVSFFQRAKLNPPIILLSYDSNNSLPAAMETRKYLEVKGIKAKIIHGNLKELAGTLKKQMQFINTKSRLENSRIGVIGVPSEWLIASKVNEQAIEKVWGTKIIYIPSSRLINFKEVEISETIKKMEDTFVDQAVENELPTQMIIEAAQVTERLLQLTQEFQLDTITVECFTLLQNTEVTSCLALSFLNDQGIIAGCEGDIPSTFTMLLLHLLTGQTPFMGNVSNIDKQKNTITLTHCTVPLKMVENYSITTHFESGKSVAIKGKFKTQQDVTILKIWGEDLTQWWVAKGKIITNLDSSSACRTQVKVSLDESVEYFLERSLANHHILILGDYKEEINTFLDSIISQT